MCELISLFQYRSGCAQSAAVTIESGWCTPFTAGTRLQVPGVGGVLGQGAEEQKGETARLVCFSACFRALLSL